MAEVRKGQAPQQIAREEFHLRFMRSFADPAFEPVQAALAQVEEIAWRNFEAGRKAPVTQKAGPEFADPDYDLSVEWRATRDRLLAAQQRQQDAQTPSRVLLIIGAARNDGTCPGEVSKTWRMSQWAQQALTESGIETDVLDLSLLTSAYDLHIHP